MKDKIQVINTIAIGSLVLAKVFGLFGVVIAYAGNQKLGGFLLLLDGLMIFSAIVFALIMSKQLEKKEETEQDLLRKLMDNGTLKYHLKEIGYYNR